MVVDIIAEAISTKGGGCFIYIYHYPVVIGEFININGDVDCVPVFIFKLRHQQEVILSALGFFSVFCASIRFRNIVETVDYPQEEVFSKPMIMCMFIHLQAEFFGFFLGENILPYV